VLKGGFPATKTISMILLLASRFVAEMARVHIERDPRVIVMQEFPAVFKSARAALRLVPEIEGNWAIRSPCR
jgi:hypothetical protein